MRVYSSCDRDMIEINRNGQSACPKKSRRKLSEEIEAKVLLPNHTEAVNIIRHRIHLANADAEFLDVLSRYMRHVDVYTALHSAGITADPMNVDEPYPHGLSQAVEARLKRYQADYDELLREKGVVDFRTEIAAEVRPKRAERQADEARTHPLAHHASATPKSVSVAKAHRRS